MHFHKRILLGNPIYPYGVALEDGKSKKRRNTECPRKGAHILKNVIDNITASVVQWSEFLATDLEARVRFPALVEKKVVGLERGPLSLMSTSEELLDRKEAAPV
jgi:hypothetical protein